MSPECPKQLDLNELTGAVKLLTENVRSVVDQNKWITKWLLIAVIVMALGQKAYDVAEKFTGMPQTAVAEGKK